MNILKTQVLNGPNFWSNYRKKLIVLTLDLGRFEELPSNLLPGFNERLQQLIPSLFEHRCSIGTPGGLFERMKEGTWLGHIIEHVALELQTMTGMDCGFGRTYSTSKRGVYKVIFSYEIEKAGLYTAKAAVELIDCLANGNEYSHLPRIIKDLQDIYADEKLGPSTEALVNEAKKRGIPYIRNTDSSLITFGQGCNQKRIWATVTSQTNSLAVDIAADKELTKNLLDSQFLPVPKGKIIESIEELDEAINYLGFPLVIKPDNGNHSRGVLTHIYDRDKAIIGFNSARQISSRVIVEHFVAGEDYRLLVIDNKLVAAAKRTPAMVIGDGLHTIKHLVEIINDDPRRGDHHENILTKISIDNETLALIAEKKFSPVSILPACEQVYLKGAANLSSGGTAMDVTEQVHPENARLAERVARLIDLDICGIDIVAEDISKPITQENGAIIEVNAGPGFRMHLHPSSGQSRNVASAVIDMLYPHDNFNIPLVAVTGTNGKTTVVRLIAHLAQKARHHVGFATTEGIYINEHLNYSGDCSGPASARAVLSDTLVDFAVLECARGGIVRSGLGFDHCDISVITNVSGDHLGLGDIETLEDLARVKEVVARSTKKTGCAILNADDNLVYAMKDNLSCRIALFAMKETSRIREHYLKGGLTAYIEEEHIVIHQSDKKHVLVNIRELPLTYNATATCMIQNILPAALAGVLSHFPLEQIARDLKSFYPTPESLPGRMNVFDFNQCRLVLDYAHNEGAFLELEKYLEEIKSEHKVGIIGATGDRRDEDIQKLGFCAAGMFDEIIIRHDRNGRGRSNQELTDLLMQGIKTSKEHPRVSVISDEFEAVRHALRSSKPGTFILYTPDDVFQAIDFIKGIQNVTEKAQNENLLL